MTSLKKTEIKEREEHVAAIRAAKEKLDDEIEDFNLKLEQLFESVAAAATEYNDKVEAANAWREDIYNVQEDYIGEKGERWQEGERGQEYLEWHEEWANSLDGIEVECPAGVEAPEMEHDDLLENLSEAPGIA